MKKRLESCVVFNASFTNCLKVVKAVNTWGKVAINSKAKKVLISLDIYAKLNLIAFDYVKLISLKLCWQCKHNHLILEIEGAGKTIVKTYKVYYLCFELTNY